MSKLNSLATGLTKAQHPPKTDDCRPPSMPWSSSASAKHTCPLLTSEPATTKRTAVPGLNPSLLPALSWLPGPWPFVSCHYNVSRRDPLHGTGRGPTCSLSRIHWFSSAFSRSARGLLGSIVLMMIDATMSLSLLMDGGRFGLLEP